MDIHLVINPASGANLTESILAEEVLPLIAQYKFHRVHEHRTNCAGDGRRIGKDLVASVASTGTTLVLVLLGGDGTTHEVLNGIVREVDGKNVVPVNVRMALVPTGTANALYASLYPGLKIDEKANMLKSLKALLSDEASEYPLALTNVTSLEATTQSNASSTMIAHLITSHALHASILADSEALRSTHPGIERFKIVSAQNISKWTNAKIHLQGMKRNGSGKAVSRYDADDSQFEEIPLSEEDVAGPILYFVCVTTDRLEPTFVPAPFSGPSSSSQNNRSLQRPSDAVDIVMIRPLLDPALKDYRDKEESFWTGEESRSIREDYAGRNAQNIFGGMYNEGQHIKLRYGGDGPYVCEYLRCAGYTWTPLEEKAKRTCVDGTVFEAEEVVVSVLSKEQGAGKVVVCK
ncbi:hypothetical protein CBS101457_003259 [Exobasidium rhododendri]|nr:hypothetical protein CBS101457_003259 [Exobasidium rhododendri]